jgi:hypothetical protein
MRDERGTALSVDEAWEVPLGRGEMMVDVPDRPAGVAGPGAERRAERPPAGLMDGVPDGAQVKKSVTAQGEDGMKTVTTAAWEHRVAARPPSDLVPRMSGLEVTRASELNPSEKSARARFRAGLAEYMAKDREQGAAVDVANRGMAGQIGAARETARGVGEAARETRKAAEAEAEMRRAESSMDWFWKGSEAEGKRRDDARADEVVKGQDEQMRWAREDREKQRAWEEEVRKRSGADVERGKQIGKPFEVREVDGVKQVHQFGDVDPRTGEPVWRNATADLWGGLGGAGQDGEVGGGAADRGDGGTTVVAGGRKWYLAPGLDRSKKENWKDLGSAQ